MICSAVNRFLAMMTPFKPPESNSRLGDILGGQVRGASLSVIGKTLGHKDPATTSIYSRLSVDPLRDPMERAVKAMLSAKDA